MSYNTIHEYTSRESTFVDVPSMDISMIAIAYTPTDIITFYALDKVS